MPLARVLIEMLVAKGVIATLGHFGYIQLSSFAVNIVVALTLGAGTDYGIFLMGRYQEARQAGDSREEAYFTAYQGVSPIIIGSGLTIAGAGFCLSFARLNYFHTMGPAVAISMLFTIAAALTLGPAILTVGSIFGLFDPKRMVKAHLYRRIGASVVRWPMPILAASCAVVMLGAVFVPTYRVSYDDRTYQPADAPANQGFAAADRHFPQSKLFTEMLMVESDHDMRNSADFISLDRVAKALIRLPGIAMVQSITRPLGRPLEHASIPYLFTTQGSGSGQQLPFTQQQNANTDKQAQIQADTVAVLGKTIDLTQTAVRRAALHGAHAWRTCSKSPTTINARDLQSRRLPPAAEELLLLGAALFRHPDLLGVPVAVRRARRHRHPRCQIAERRHLPAGRRRASAAADLAAEDHGRRHPRPCRPSSSTPTAPRICSPRRPIRPSTI